MSEKRRIRAAFRAAVFRRDGYRCVLCGKPGYDRQDGDRVRHSRANVVALDAHHVTDRNEMPNGGYVPENGITLCDDGCHARAEVYHQTGIPEPGHSPAELYAQIGSSYDAAYQASLKLAGVEPGAGAQDMGATRDEFVKYPRTPHLFGSTGTSDDKHLGERASRLFVADESLIVEEKLDGTNVGIHFETSGRLVLQCRGHRITAGMHPQYDLFKQWAGVKRHVLEERLEDRYVMYGEWLYARHSIHYQRLPHYFFEFDIYDKPAGEFLSLERRTALLDGTGILTVPVVNTGPVRKEELPALIGPSGYDSRFDNPLTHQPDDVMEGLYLRTERGGVVTGRAKFVRPEFVERVKLSEHWQHQALVPNLLRDDADIWA